MSTANMREKEVFLFCWPVPEGGFRWTDPSPKGSPIAQLPREEALKPHLVPMEEWHRVRWRDTYPLEDEENRGHFLEFADLEPTQESVLVIG